MPRKCYRPEDILSKLREADILTRQGRIVVETIRVLCISDVPIIAGVKNTEE